MQNIEEIYQQYAQTVYKYLFCLTGKEDISEDLTQETFVIAVKEIAKFRGECKISVWLCQIAKHLWYKELKRKKIMVELENVQEDLENQQTIEEIFLAKEERIELFKEIQRLEEKTKEVMYLRIVGDLSFAEIGEVMGKSENWARVTFFRGKQKIREERNNGKKKGM